MAGNTALQALRVGGNRMGEDAAMALLQALRPNHTLQVLDLRGNGLGQGMLSRVYRQSLTILV